MSTWAESSSRRRAPEGDGETAGEQGRQEEDYEVQAEGEEQPVRGESLFGEHAIEDEHGALLQRPQQEVDAAARRGRRVGPPAGQEPAAEHDRPHVEESGAADHASAENDGCRHEDDVDGHGRSGHNADLESAVQREYRQVGHQHDSGDRDQHERPRPAGFDLYPEHG